MLGTSDMLKKFLTALIFLFALTANAQNTLPVRFAGNASRNTQIGMFVRNGIVTRIEQNYDVDRYTDALGNKATRTIPSWVAISTLPPCVVTVPISTRPSLSRTSSAASGDSRPKTAAIDRQRWWFMGLARGLIADGGEDLGSIG